VDGDQKINAIIAVLTHILTVFTLCTPTLTPYTLSFGYTLWCWSRKERVSITSLILRKYFTAEKRIGGKDYIHSHITLIALHREIKIRNPCFGSNSL